MMVTTGRPAGLQVAQGRPCTKCGGPMFIKPAPCFMAKRGWATCVKCIRCGNTEGYQPRLRKRT